jgi:hypothetical protein
MSKIPCQSIIALRCVALKEINLVDTSLLVVPLFTRQVEAPFLTIGQNGHRHTTVESVLKELTIPTFGLPDPLHFEKNLRSIAPVAEGEVNASTFERVFRRNTARIENRPPEFVQHWQHNTLRNRSLICEAAAS